MNNQPKRRITPFHINLEQQKKRAKELLRDLRLADEHATARFKQYHPGLQDSHDTPTTTTTKLSDAQLVIARELGTGSWAKLKAHVVGMQEAAQVIDAGTQAPDSELKTLHIRCGTDIEHTLQEAGFCGDFLEYSDPICQGPVCDSADLQKLRADFLSSSYGSEMNISAADIYSDLKSKEEHLQQTARNYQRVILWFEHDSYDQLILARLLAHFAAHELPPALELVLANHFPGSERFIGLGQLPPEAIRLLWDKRTAVNPQQLTAGQRCWQALKAPTPTSLTALIQSEDIHALPDMARAIRRHLQELPSVSNGLGLTEQLALTIVSEQSLSAGQVFRILMLEREPLPWLGDTMFWHIVRAMTAASKPLLVISENDADEPWPKRILSITNTGRKVLAEESDWLSLHPPERWLGGILVRADEPCWRWDDEKAAAILIRQ